MSRRGSILVLAIFFLFVVQLLAFAFVGLLPVELLSAGRTRLDVGASLAAEAGVQYTVAWMEEELRQGREPIQAPANQVTLSKAVVGWTWTVVARPDAQTPPSGRQQSARLSSDRRGLPAGRRQTLRTPALKRDEGEFCQLYALCGQVAGGHLGGRRTRPDSRTFSHQRCLSPHGLQGLLCRATPLQLAQREGLPRQSDGRRQRPQHSRRCRLPDRFIVRPDDLFDYDLASLNVTIYRVEGKRAQQLPLETYQRL